MSNVPLIAVVIEDPTFPDSAAVVAGGLQHHVAYEFGPRWNLGAKVQSYPSRTDVPNNAWLFSVLQNSDQAGALGYHDLTPAGRPLGKVFYEEDKKYGYDSWITMTHEIDEMLADPYIDTCVQYSRTTFWSYEVCDAVEADVYGHDMTFYVAGKRYVRKATDFVTPAWFNPDMPGPYDFSAHVNDAFEILDGGYIGQWTPANGWTQLTVGQTAQSRRIPLREKKAAGGLLANSYFEL